MSVALDTATLLSIVDMIANVEADIATRQAQLDNLLDLLGKKQERLSVLRRQFTTICQPWLTR